MIQDTKAGFFFYFSTSVLMCFKSACSSNLNDLISTAFSSSGGEVGVNYSLAQGVRTAVQQDTLYFTERKTFALMEGLSGHMRCNENFIFPFRMCKCINGHIRGQRFVWCLGRPSTFPLFLPESSPTVVVKGQWGANCQTHRGKQAKHTPRNSATHHSSACAASGF